MNIAIGALIPATSTAARALPAGTEPPIEDSEAEFYQMALFRAEHVVETLRRRGRGRKLDNKGAERMLQYLRARAARQPVADTDEEAAISWLAGNGQSLDWIFLGDTSGMICRLANVGQRGGTAT